MPITYIVHAYLLGRIDSFSMFILYAYFVMSCMLRIAFPAVIIAYMAYTTKEPLNEDQAKQSPICCTDQRPV